MTYYTSLYSLYSKNTCLFHRLANTTSRPCIKCAAPLKRPFLLVARGISNFGSPLGTGQGRFTFSPGFNLSL